MPWHQHHVLQGCRVAIRGSSTRWPADLRLLVHLHRTGDVFDVVVVVKLFVILLLGGAGTVMGLSTERSSLRVSLRCLEQVS